MILPSVYFGYPHLPSVIIAMAAPQLTEQIFAGKDVFYMLMNSVNKTPTSDAQYHSIAAYITMMQHCKRHTCVIEPDRDEFSQLAPLLCFYHQARAVVTAEMMEAIDVVIARAKKNNSRVVLSYVCDTHDILVAYAEDRLAMIRYVEPTSVVVLYRFSETCETIPLANAIQGLP